ncbi:MAG TPA: Maf family protein [Phycisphaerales bacterium]|nr:Maf family protein [Phycisphaerales bacterium]
MLHLASTSPRRRKLLEEAGIPHVVVPGVVDDAGLEPGRVAPGAWVAALAFLKAASVGTPRSADAGAVVLGADTVVVKNGELIGQPRDEADARRILGMLEDGAHEVVTGVALLEPGTGRRELFTDTARVKVGRIGSERLERYLAGGGWRGKAGGYNLAERLADGWPISFEGDAGTIMGLPVRMVRERLGRFAPGGVETAVRGAATGRPRREPCRCCA